eukprot:11173798-Lingulodinium_polyedra.AAC.1
MAAQFSSAHAAKPWLRPAAVAPASASSMLALACPRRRAQTTRNTASMGPTVLPPKLGGCACPAARPFF